MKVLVLNCGSSTLKAALRELDEALPSEPPAPLWEAKAEWGRQSGKAHLLIGNRDGSVHEDNFDIGSISELVHKLIEGLWSGQAKVISGPDDIAAVGHRVVHGGREFREATFVTAEVHAGIEKCAEFAPEHNRLALEVIDAATQSLGKKIPQVAVFDTAFHSTLPASAKVYPVPFELYEQGIERYGFHGISHKYASRRAAEIMNRKLDDLRIVTCHLGNGASLAAIRDGKCIDTTMGFTPLEGLMMGTRSGSIDPGILIYLVRHRQYGADQLDRLLNKESGLKGVSGISGDMREVLAAGEQGEERAKLAFDVYAHRLCREIGAMAASLGGLDALVFTAGIGENTPGLRAATCRQLAFLGINLDMKKNENSAGDSDIALEESPVRILVIHSEEEWEIARECQRLIARKR